MSKDLHELVEKLKNSISISIRLNRKEGTIVVAQREVDKFLKEAEENAVEMTPCGGVVYDSIESIKAIPIGKPKEAEGK